MTTAEAAAALNVSRRRVNELIKLGTLQAIKPGRDWEIDPATVEAYKNSPRKAGPKRKKNVTNVASERYSTDSPDTSTAAQSPKTPKK